MAFVLAVVSQPASHSVSQLVKVVVRVELELELKLKPRPELKLKQTS